MSGLENTVRRMVSFSKGKGYSTSKERAARAASREQAAKDKMFASSEIPDDEEVRRNERRKAAKRRGSRVSTVLSDQDTLG